MAGGCASPTPSDASWLAAKRVGRKGLFGIGTIATPDTLLRWYRRLVAQKYDGSRARGVGRPRTAAEIERLIVMMAQANPGWGYTRIRGALYNLAHEIGRNTIKRILLENGLEPAPERAKKPCWETFLKSPWCAEIRPIENASDDAALFAASANSPGLPLADAPAYAPARADATPPIPELCLSSRARGLVLPRTRVVPLAFLKTSSAHGSLTRGGPEARLDSGRDPGKSPVL